MQSRSKFTGQIGDQTKFSNHVTIGKPAFKALVTVVTCESTLLWIDQ